MRVILIVLPVFVLGAWASTSGPEVLVVGEDRHAHVARLPNPGFEAIDMSSALWRSGLEPMKEHRAARVAPTGTGSTRASQERLSAPRSFRGLVSDVAQVRGVQRVRQLRIATVAAEADTEGDAEPPIFALLEQRVVPGGLRRERFPQLSYDQFVVVVRDAAGRELDWRLVRNPAIVRADVPGPDGRLQGGTIEVVSTELSIAIPDAVGVDRVYLYRPRWTGTEYLLDPFGQVQLGQ